MHNAKQHYIELFSYKKLAYFVENIEFKDKLESFFYCAKTAQSISEVFLPRIDDF